ncbi:hypothetical protein ACS0OX_17225 [Stenotrophomonas pavanii]|uniref:hypothetical protein n=1 Tax=Stenotrophomonas pavanii TaxID=487698 RepID=UPI003F9E6B2F
MRKENRPADGASQRSAKLAVPLDKGQTLEEKSAGLIAEGIASNAFVSLLFAQHSGVAGGNELNELVKSTRAAVGRAAKGGTDQADGLLTSQAIALNAVFLEMSRRAALNMGEHMGAMETYMRLALKAQSQCRTTLETLAEIKNPRAVAFVKQANIAGGHQQVNNPPPGSPGPFPNGAGRAERKIRPNELLEEISDAQWLDPGAAPATGAGNPELATMGAGDRPAQRRRKGQGR